MAKSILQDERECYLCNLLYGTHNHYNLHEHHVFQGTANRRKSEHHGLKVYLCAEHHNTSQYAVHFNPDLDLRLKVIAQTEFEKEHSREEFMKEFGRSWKDD